MDAAVIVQRADVGGLPARRSSAGTRPIREAMARDGLDAVIVSGNEYTGFEGAVTYMSRLRDRPPLRVRAASARGRSRRSCSRARPATSASTGRRGSRSRSSSTGPASGSPTACAASASGVYGLDYVMTVRDYRRARGRGRDRPLGPRLRPRARGQERVRARVGARQRAHQHRGLLDLPRRVRGRQERARDPRAVRGVLRRAGLRPPDDGHGARPARTALRCPSSRSRARGRRSRATWCCRRSRSPGRAATGSRSRARSAPASRATRRSACSRRTRSTTRPRAPCSRTARPRTTRTGRSRRASPTEAAALGHVTGHSIGMTMIEFPKVGEGDRHRAAERAWCSRCTRT